MSEHQPIEETDVYRRVADLSDEVWELVQGWKPLAIETVGRQLIRSMDSVGANLVEGDGRYSTNDSIHFFVIARASARESGFWIRRAKKRGLIRESVAEDLAVRLEHATRALNNIITYRRNKGPGVKESTAIYADFSDKTKAPNTQHPTPNT